MSDPFDADRFIARADESNPTPHSGRGVETWFFGVRNNMLDSTSGLRERIKNLNGLAVDLLSGRVFVNNSQDHWWDAVCIATEGWHCDTGRFSLLSVNNDVNSDQL
jgi:hypothetical protein